MENIRIRSPTSYKYCEGFIGGVWKERVAKGINLLGEKRLKERVNFFRKKKTKCRTNYCYERIKNYFCRSFFG